MDHLVVQPNPKTRELVLVEHGTGVLAVPQLDRATDAACFHARHGRAVESRRVDIADRITYHVANVMASALVGYVRAICR
jgi:hypothetical protein